MLILADPKTMSSLVAVIFRFCWTTYGLFGMNGQGLPGAASYLPEQVCSMDSGHTAQKAPPLMRLAF